MGIGASIRVSLGGTLWWGRAPPGQRGGQPSPVWVPSWSPGQGSLCILHVSAVAVRTQVSARFCGPGGPSSNSRESSRGFPVGGPGRARRGCTPGRACRCSLEPHGDEGHGHHDQVQDVEVVPAEGALVEESPISSHLQGAQRSMGVTGFSACSRNPCTPLLPTSLCGQVPSTSIGPSLRGVRCQRTGG